MADNSKSIESRIAKEETIYENLQEMISQEIRVCIPGKITKINYSEMTVSVKPLIREELRDDMNLKTKKVALPLLQDVPIVYPSTGEFAITFPITVGDECLVIFADMCIDNWWSKGGIQDQFETRRHDLSDAFCIPSRMSQPKRIRNINQDNLEIRNLNTGYKIILKGADCTIGGHSIEQLFNNVQALLSAMHTHE